jgi:molybdate transport system regulatory protein
MTKAFLRVYFRPDARLGPGKIRLLELVGETSSIAEAARKMNNMSYRRAWMLIRSLNTMFSEPVLETMHGGKGGGGAALTTFGANLIRRFRAFEENVTVAAAHEFADLEAALSSKHVSEMSPSQPVLP